MEIVLFKKKYVVKNTGEQGVLVDKKIENGEECFIFEPDSYGNGTSNCIKVTKDDLIEPNYAAKK